ncbi:TetR family transcriptional regulator [Luteimonas cucumeris]|uniref:TetR family transcriptional regulator n=1 Tax=Luteimonas cucumeris TaxID=985012 RepID=A0A562KXT1_9GAMM|nr:TetR/AcrR family transcriptional regulator [Luteimonas cucumeris]TWI00240.1 TetR family transcriptional regulator [Luteimonas cucumeris]
MKSQTLPRGATGPRTKAHKQITGKPAPAKRASAKRTPGRPQRDAQDLRQQLLDATVTCFVRDGIAATSLRAIAAQAGVTPALLHYYFGDKAQLQEAFIEERMLPAFAIVRGAVQRAGDDVAATVAAFTNGLIEAVRQQPWWPQVWVREVLCEGGALRDLLVTRIAPELARVIAARFAAAQSRGELNSDLDPRLLMTSLIGLTLLPIAGAPIWRSIFEADDIALDDVRRHALALLDRGLELK